MASYTSNLNLKKPSGSENVAIGDINNNMDLIDSAYGELESSIDNFVPSKLLSVESASYDISIGNNGRHLLAIGAANAASRVLVLFVSVSATGDVTVAQVFKGSSVSYTTGTNKITVTQNTSTANVIADLKLNGSFVSVSAV